ncbi:MAG: class I SAM-dependent methyltransferase [Chloroflexota bacterium]
MQILEVGAGAGGVLLEYMVYGARPENLYGCDLLPGRVSQAQALLPHSHQACADGQRLPYCSDGFDLALQYTAFSSVLSQPVKANIAAEMLRVLKPGGWVLWYDFWLNPTNPHTQGIRKTEIRALFPNCRYVFRRVTLAPPLARQLAPLSWGLAYLLEKVKLLNTHYLAAVQPLPG